MRKRERQAVAWIALYNFVAVALFPRAVHFFYPPLFRTPAGLALHVTWRVTYAFVTFRWIRPRVLAQAKNGMSRVGALGSSGPVNRTTV